MRLGARQISAAMALAGMTQDELASLAGIARPSLNRILNEEVLAKDDTLNKIRHALESRNIEFIPAEGVRRHFGTVDRLEGGGALHRFYDDVYETVKDGGELCVSGVDERLFVKFYADDAAGQFHRERMNAIKDRLKFRVLLKEGDTYYRNTSYIEYRWIQKQFFFEHPIYVYNNKLAFIKFDKSNLEILRIAMPSMATAFRLQFDFMWEHSIVPPPRKRSI